MYIITRHKNQEASPSSVIEGGDDFVYYVESDAEALRKLKVEAQRIQGTRGKVPCNLILEDATTLWVLLTAELSNEITENLDLFATTYDDIAAKRLLADGGLFLDRNPIGPDSNVTVHLVVLGFSQLAEALAMNAALVAHYPNYCYDHSKRTRITIIDDDVIPGARRLTNRYRNLFENSYYRILDLDDVSPKAIVHEPQYSPAREDFVDVEWEFVKGSIHHDAVRAKLKEWSLSETQQLTVAIAQADGTRSVSEAYNLPEDVYAQKIPVLCCSPLGSTAEVIGNDGLFSNVRLFSTDEIDMSFIEDLRRRAMGINYVYNWIFGLGPEDPVAAPVTIDIKEAERLWHEVPTLQKQYSNIYNAMTLKTKLHSIGHENADTSTGSAQAAETYFALSKKDIDMLVEVEHNRWSVEELILGYRPVTDEEQETVENDVSQKKVLRARRIHYDLRSYKDLREDQTGKNVNIYDWALTQALPILI